MIKHQLPIFKFSMTLITISGSRAVIVATNTKNQKDPSLNALK